MTVKPTWGAHPFRVVIDPGHGGSDRGAIFEQNSVKITEKDITLKLAKQVARHLRSRGLLVTLTRNEDEEISLPARTTIANHLGADIFISIHMNSTQGFAKKDTEGVETYILNNATDASSKRLAHLENSIISPQLTHAPEQVDVALILKDLRLDANLSESKRLACHVQSNLVTATSKLNQKTILKRRNRGVKQALFHVLLGADMPSILVEAGFLNSAHDRSIFLSPQGQSLMSHAIADAIDQYRGKQKASENSFILSRCKVN